MRVKKIVRLLLLVSLVFPTLLSGEETSGTVDYETFLERHDMLWDRVPHRWEVSPYTGNGNVGFLFYQAESEAKNTISIYAGRHDYYDHRLPYEDQEMLWIYRSRLSRRARTGHQLLSRAVALELSGVAGYQRRA